MSDRERIYIVSGTYEEYKQYKTRKFEEFLELPPTQEFVEFPDYVYVQHPENLKGVSNPKGFYIGTYKERPDIGHIQLLVRMAKTKHDPLPNPTKII
jgi:hypothetical protein